ncbi:PAS domain S-box protein [Kiloniella laminariae]|uniref:histidine kinase n=1 Tax=Kiloniella laminariae TaxID=454162 RepID=A0ABT4LP34_9PROT|nr:ATP-binding protein [Kiloniella laminariae]MCZ4282874.1 PAS domain S-box protein [Kiloniella laminariae]
MLKGGAGQPEGKEQPRKPGNIKNDDISRDDIKKETARTLSVRNLRNRAVQLNVFAFLLSALLIGLWVKSTYDEVAAEVDTQVQTALNKMALPLDLFLGRVESKLGQAEWSGLSSNNLHLAPLSIPKDDVFDQWQYITILGKTGAVLPGWPVIPLPAQKELDEMILRVSVRERAMISLPYQYDGQWFATAIRPGMESLQFNNDFIVSSFKINDFLNWWAILGLPKGSLISIQTSDQRLWLDDHFSNDLVGRRTPYKAGDFYNERPRVMTDLDGVERILLGRELSRFGLTAVVGVPSDFVSQIWRDRYFASVGFAVLACLIMMTVLFVGGRSIVVEARRREGAVSALKDSERRFRDIAGAATDWFWEMGPELRFSFVSQLQEWNLLGKSLIDLQGQDLADGRLLKTLETRQAFRDLELLVPDLAGTPRIIRLSGVPIFDEEDEFIGYRGAGSDITERRLDQQKMATAHARLFRAFESFSGAVTLYDEEDKLVAFNRRFQEIFFPGRPMAIRVGMTYKEVIVSYANTGQDPRSLEQQDRYIETLLQRRGKRNREFRLTEDVWLKVIDHRTPENDLFTVYTDISDFKAREQELLDLSSENHRLAAAVSSTDAGVLIADATTANCSVVYINPAFTRLTGYNLAEAKELHAGFLQGRETDPKVRKQLESALQDYHHVCIDMLNYRRDGKTFWNQFDLSPIFAEDGTIQYFVCVMHDISSQKEVEKELTVLKESAELANRTKSEFMALMSHELRTPLNAILGFSEILANEMFGPLGSPRYKDYARDVNESGTHLLDLINDILDLSKAEAGKIELVDELLDLNSVVQRCSNMLSDRAVQAGLEFSQDLAEDLPVLRGDERRIKQVLINLISNALKFTPAGGAVSVMSRLSERGIELVVRDNGIGMSEDDIPKALAPFGQVDSSLSRKHEGTGLGLPLSKRLTEMHGADFVLESTPDVGTVVTLIFPIEKQRMTA